MSIGFLDIMSKKKDGDLISSQFISLLLLRCPLNVFGDGFVFQQFFAGVVFFGEFFFVGDERMDGVVAEAAQVEAAALHFLLAVATDESLFRVHFARDQVVECQTCPAAAQFAVRGQVCLSSLLFFVG